MLHDRDLYQEPFRFGTGFNYDSTEDYLKCSYCGDKFPEEELIKLKESRTLMCMSCILVSDDELPALDREKVLIARIDFEVEKQNSEARKKHKKTALTN